jgi:hypothetical protein
VDEQGSLEAPGDDNDDDEVEQLLSALNTSTDEGSALENGVGEGNHNIDDEQVAENEDSDIEEILTAQDAERIEETEDDTNIVTVIEEQQGIAVALHSDEDDDRESVSGDTEPPENDSAGM